jgi:protein-S-isoprenylcysteine O-methyltransferase Ste14
MKTERPDNAEVAFHPPRLLLATIVLGFAARWLAPLSFLPVVVSRTAGPIIFSLSVVLFIWSVFSLRRGGASIPTGEPTERIISSGPYGFSRNPIYLAMILLQIGISFWANSLWFLLFAALSAALLVWGVISREELYLESKFGADYVAYKTRVRRWL